MPTSKQPYESVTNFLSNMLYLNRNELVKHANVKKGPYRFTHEPQDFNTRYGKEFKLMFLLTQEMVRLQSYLQRSNLQRSDEQTALLTAETGTATAGESPSLTEQAFYDIIKEALQRVNANSKPNLCTGSVHFLDLLNSSQVLSLAELRENIAMQTSIEFLYKMIRRRCTKFTRQLNWPFLPSLIVEDYIVRFRLQMIIATVIKLLLNDFPLFDFLPISPGKNERAGTLVMFALLPLAISIIIVVVKAYFAGQLAWHNWRSPLPAIPEPRAEPYTSLLKGLDLPSMTAEIFRREASVTSTTQVDFRSLKQEFMRKKGTARLDLGSFAITFIFVFIWYFFADGYVNEGSELNNYNQYTIFPLLLLPLCSELLKMVLKRWTLY